MCPRNPGSSQQLAKEPSVSQDKLVVRKDQVCQVKKSEELSIIWLNKETIARYKEFHKVEPQPAMDARIEEVLTDREDSDSDIEELDDFDVNSDFEEDDLNDD